MLKIAVIAVVLGALGVVLKLGRRKQGQIRQRRREILERLSGRRDSR